MFIKIKQNNSILNMLMVLLLVCIPEEIILSEDEAEAEKEAKLKELNEAAATASEIITAAEGELEKANESKDQVAIEIAENKLHEANENLELIEGEMEEVEDPDDEPAKKPGPKKKPRATRYTVYGIVTEDFKIPIAECKTEAEAIAKIDYINSSMEKRRTSIEV